VGNRAAASCQPASTPESGLKLFLEAAMTLLAQVAIAYHGDKNREHLGRVLAEWAGMQEIKAQVDILTDRDLKPGQHPASLPFLAREALVKRLGTADMYVYSEDDILITEANLLAWWQVSRFVRSTEVPGLVRYEVAEPSGERRFPDMHGSFHWENAVVEREIDGVREKFAWYTNAHSGCYVLDGVQLLHAMASGGFLVAMHSDQVYGALERGASDVYLQCGLRRLVPLTRFSQFLVHHLPDSYLHMGKPEAAVRAELKAMGVEWR
jgi:hypothetical protein